MKNVIKIAALAIIVCTGVTSCKKNYTCSCSKTYTKSDGSTYTYSDGAYTFDDTKVRAAERCNAQEGSGSDLSGEYTRDCDIK